jgi:ribonucleoside-diphosphate reductase alpha chain
MSNMQLPAKILSDITTFMKYAKFIPEKKRRENWSELVDRNMQMHIEKYPFLEEEIRGAYKLVYEKKVLPSMRSLQFAGKPIAINNARLYNCCFLPIDHVDAFSEVMFLLLSGTGVGYSVQRHHVEKLPEINKPTKTRRYLIGDSIEGWADAVKVLMTAYLKGKALPVYDFSDIRPKGAQLITSGGKAPGPEPLKDCLHNVQKILDRKQNGEKLTTLEVHDILCYIADAVLAGGIRRSAMIALFNIDDDDMLTCKFGEWYIQNPQRGRANNSAVIVRHMVDEEVFMDLWKKIEMSGSGEPGFFFTNDKDWGMNPCAEISLRPFQFCNLTTINAGDVESQEDFEARAKAAALIGTLQASYTNFHYLRDIWKRTTEKEALIGVSMTGIASGAVLTLDMKNAAKVVKEENVRVAVLIGTNPASRCTTVKPEGCLTLDTKIKTTEGIKSMAEIASLLTSSNIFELQPSTWIEPEKDVFIFNENNEQERISKLFINGHSEVYEITTEDGTVVKLTSEHKLKTHNGWKCAKELIEGDEIIAF